MDGMELLGSNSKEAHIYSSTDDYQTNTRLGPEFKPPRVVRDTGAETVPPTTLQYQNARPLVPKACKSWCILTRKDESITLTHASAAARDIRALSCTDIIVVRLAIITAC